MAVKRIAAQISAQAASPEYAQSSENGNRHTLNQVKPVQHTGFEEDIQALAQFTQCTQQILSVAALGGSLYDC